MRMTAAEYNKLNANGKIRGIKLVKPAAAKKSKLPKPEPAGVTYIKECLQQAGIAYRTEYYFAKPERLFRFDIAVPAMMLAIEYEGLVATGKKGGHQTKEHYTNNCTKYNLAAAKGWKLYRYTCRNYKDFEKDLYLIVDTNISD